MPSARFPWGFAKVRLCPSGLAFCRPATPRSQHVCRSWLHRFLVGRPRTASASLNLFLHLLSGDNDRYLKEGLWGHLGYGGHLDKPKACPEMWGSSSQELAHTAWREPANCLDSSIPSPAKWRNYAQCMLGKGQGAPFSQHFPLPTACQAGGYRDQGEPGPSGSVGKPQCQPGAQST